MGGLGAGKMRGFEEAAPGVPAGGGRNIEMCEAGDSSDSPERKKERSLHRAARHRFAVGKQGRAASVGMTKAERRLACRALPIPATAMRKPVPRANCQTAFLRPSGLVCARRRARARR
jgi:hypothetical protein